MTQPAQYFRAGTGAVIVNRHGEVLVCQRRDVPGAWQFPQGGLEAGEEPFDAVLREVLEETGVSQGALELVDRAHEPLVYELPGETRSAKTGRGQVQYWFLFRMHRHESLVELPADSEFTAFKWVPFDEARRDVVWFKRPVYHQLRNQFARALSLP